MKLGCCVVIGYGVLLGILFGIGFNGSMFCLALGFIIVIVTWVVIGFGAASTSQAKKNVRYRIKREKDIEREYGIIDYSNKDKKS